MIRELGAPRALDTLLQDGMLWPISYRAGQVGYLKDGYTFVHLDKDTLVKVKEGRAGSVTWQVDEKRPKQTRTSAPKNYKIDLCYHGGNTVHHIVRGVDSPEAARSRALKWFAASNRLNFPQVFSFFKSNPQAISVKEL